MQRSNLTEHRNRLVFRWLAIPWLQQEADSYVYNHNTSRRRASRRKILPKGIPDAMFENLELVSARDFKVSQSFDQDSTLTPSLVDYRSGYIDRRCRTPMGTTRRPGLRPCSPRLRGAHFIGLCTTREPRREFSFVLGCLQTGTRCCGPGPFVPVQRWCNR